MPAACLAVDYLADGEREALEAVEAFVRDGYARADRTHDQTTGFVMVIFQKLMASSIRALRMSLSRRAERWRRAAGAPSVPKRAKATIAEIEDRLEQDEYSSALLDEVAVADAEEAGEFERLGRQCSTRCPATRRQTRSWPGYAAHCPGWPFQRSRAPEDRF